LEIQKHCVQPLAFETLGPLSFFKNCLCDRTWSSTISGHSLYFAAFIVHRCSKIHLCSSQETFLNQSQSHVNWVARTQLGQLLNEVKRNKTVVKSIDYENH